MGVTLCYFPREKKVHSTKLFDILEPTVCLGPRYPGLRYGDIHLNGSKIT